MLLALVTGVPLDVWIEPVFVALALIKELKLEIEIITLLVGDLIALELAPCDDDVFVPRKLNNTSHLNSFIFIKSKHFTVILTHYVAMHPTAPYLIIVLTPGAICSKVD